MHHNNEAAQQCIRECQQCFAACLENLTHCLSKGERHAAPDHIVALLDCADASQTAAAFMLRQSPHHPQVCDVCAQVCDACANSCEQIGDDERMRACADECRRCAESCRQMAAAAV
jgi:hypothetical protein